MRDWRGLLGVGLTAIACGTPLIATSPEDELRASPAELDFGEVYASERASAVVQVANPGRRSRTVQLELAPPFFSPPRLDVPGGSSVSLQVEFAPPGPGPFEGTLKLGATVVRLRGAGRTPLECRPPASSCRSSSFDPASGQCVLANLPDGASCASLCVTSGSCSSGSCLGTFADCSDGNACTDDGCTEAGGCVHTPKSCPGSPTNPCRVPSCDPLRGCQLTDAVDGTSCGPRSCRTRTTPVCIAAQCVDRPLPTTECLNLFAYLKASNAEPADAFGSRVALSADGSTLAVGSFVEASGATGIDGDQTDNSAPQAGAVYVFRRVTGAWIQEAYLKASNTAAGASFGYSVALAADGSTLVAGAHLEDGAFADSGAAYVFRRAAGSWIQDGYLKASNRGPGDRFGASVALSGDGETAAVAAPGEDGDGDESGAVYLFHRAGPAWVEERYLKASTIGGGDQFGFSVALSGDGSTLAVSAPGEDSKATGSNGDQADNGSPQSGAVYVFRRSTGWAQDAYLKASNTGAGDGFGIGLALSAGGEVLAAGAWGEDSSAAGVNGQQADNSASQSGAAYLFRRSPAGWAQEAYLKASNTQLGDNFGFSLALTADGNAVAIGAWSENSSATGIDGHQFNNGAFDSGAVYLFRRGTEWAQDAYLKASNTEPGDLFGYSVAISGDGNTLASGALGEDSQSRGINGSQADNSATDSGAVYVFSTQ